MPDAIRKFKEFEPCRDCIDKVSPKGLTGFYYVGEGSDRKIKECPCHKKWVRETLIKVKIKDAHIDKFLETSILLTYNPLKDYVGKESREAMQQMVYIKDNFKDMFIHTPIYMYGEFKTQKTTLAKWLGISLIKKGFSAYYINMHKIMEALNLTFNDDKAIQQQELIKKLLSVDLLIIDECFDKIKVRMYASGVQFPALDSFLRDRIDQERKCTLFVSNVLPSNIEKEGFSDSIQDFVQRKIKEDSTLLEFKDNYDRVKNKFKDFKMVN